MAAEVSTKVVEQPCVLEVKSVEVRVVEGRDRGAQRRLGAGGIRIGTGAMNDLQLTDPTVSRLHCEIRNLDGAVRIVDSGSTNGTHVDGVRIHVAELAA